MQRYSARINAFILLQTYYNSRRGVSQAFDSPAGLCYTGQKCSPEVLSCSLSPNVFFLIPLQPDGMRALLARTTDPELIQPYTDMLDLSLAHPEQWVWYTAWGLYQNDSRRLVGDLCFKGLPENGQPEIGYGLLPEYEHQGYATEAVRAACRWAFEQPGVTAVEAETDPIMLPRRRCCTGWVLFRPGLWARKGRGLFCAKSLDFIAKSALSPLHLPQLVP